MKYFLAVVALCAATLSAQTAGNFALVAPSMQTFVNNGEAAGIVTLIATRDTVLHVSATGKTDLARQRQMRRDDIFWIASMSKPVTAVCIAKGAKIKSAMRAGNGWWRTSTRSCWIMQ